MNEHVNRDSRPEPVLTPEQLKAFGSTTAVDVIDRNTVAGLTTANPNVAAGQGDYNHEDHIGDEEDDDNEVAAARARLASGGMV